MVTEIFNVPTGKIAIGTYGEGRKVEFLSIGDYGKKANMMARFLGLPNKIMEVPHQEMLPLEKKWVITISTQFGCSIGCNFCDVPKVGPGINVPYNLLMKQVEAARGFHPEVWNGERLNIHFARMGEPTFNRDVLSAIYALKLAYEKSFKVVHPVISTMMPAKNPYLLDYLKQFMFLKNSFYDGEAGLQLSINSTDEKERSVMFNDNCLPLDIISLMMKEVIAHSSIRGRKLTLNFALGNYKIDVDRIVELFHPNHFIIKLTPMHITNSVISNGVKWQQDPYPVEEEFHNAGFDVIVFVPSEEEDKGRITCGNAILSGSKPEVEYSVIKYE